MKAFETVVKVTVNFKNIVQLKQLKKLHHFFTDIANLKVTKIYIGGFHYRKKYTKARAIDKAYAFEIQDKFCIRFVKKIVELLLYRFCNQCIEPVDVFEGCYIDIVY